MQKADIFILASALNALAEVFDRKSVSQKGVDVWFETLREFPAERVLGLLSSWPKTHAKMPVPAEVWKIANEFGIEERERRNRDEKAIREREYANMQATPRGDAALKLIKQMLAKPKRTPIEHWEHVLATPGLADISYEYAKIGLAKLRRRNPVEERVEERVVGEDDQ